MLTFVVKVSSSIMYDVRWTSQDTVRTNGNRGGCDLHIRGGRPYVSEACRATRRRVLARVNTLIATCVAVNNGNLNSFRVINKD